MKFKIGDNIYCHTACIMDDGEIATTVGKYYKVINIISKSLLIIDDSNCEHYFTIKNDNDCYKHWFSNIKKERKAKLKKLNKSFEV